ncbi:MAG: RdgB/HAM1 family non-canonical purine NTP pyrophosphatase [Chitinophagia bacterium]|nr:RdgB/HAM1 family non-canonical purine NTP pyrophosphatase [Chitinophagia bacterium]
MHQLVMASNNKGKLREIRQLLTGFDLLTLGDIGFTADIPEPFATFRENAHTKAQTIYNYSGKSCFADDSGLCVDALNGAPGVDSAHYSGSRNDEENLQRVLQQLRGINTRNAHYQAIICLIWEGETYYFEGICPGIIALEKAGNGGFGYDPIFIPDGYQQTFAALDDTTKNAISHRGIAVRKMVSFLTNRTTLQS